MLCKHGVSGSIPLASTRGHLQSLFEKLFEDGGRRGQRESVGPAGDSDMGQVVKSMRWMPWHQEAMKDAGACDTPGRAGKRASTPGFPNGETHSESCRCTRKGANAGN